MRSESPWTKAAYSQCMSIGFADEAVPAPPSAAATLIMAFVPCGSGNCVGILVRPNDALRQAAG